MRSRGSGRFVGHGSARVPHDVGVAVVEPEYSWGVEAGVHAGNDGEFLGWRQARGLVCDRFDAQRVALESTLVLPVRRGRGLWAVLDDRIDVIVGFAAGFAEANGRMHDRDAVRLLGIGLSGSDVVDVNDVVASDSW